MFDAQEKARLSGLQTPDQVRARERTRQQFAGLSAGAAAKLAEERFSPLVNAPSTGPLSSGQRADRYVGDFAAVVNDAGPGGKDAFVVSGHPLRTTNADGQLAPVDVTLAHAGDAWKPINALEPYSIASGTGALDFADLGIGVTAAGQKSQAQQLGASLFFADTQTDTDTLLKSGINGAQYAWILRSQASPQDIALDVTLPAGAGLTQPDANGVRIVKDGKAMGAITQPVAEDAQGRPVDASLKVDGDQVHVVVEHRGKDVAYPIAVDPEVTAGFYFPYYGVEAANWPYWFTYDYGRFDVWGGDGPYGRGLHIASQNYPTYYNFDPGSGPGSAERAGLYYAAPGNAYIYKMYNTLSRNITGESLGGCMLVGIADVNVANWEGPYGTTWGEGCAPFASYAWTVQATSPTRGNTFVFGAYAHSSVSTAFQMYFQDAEIRMIDDDAPTVTQVNAPTDDWLNGDHTGGLRGFGSDPSTGVKSITFSANGWSSTVTNPKCAYGPCSKLWDNGGSGAGDPPQYVPVSALPEGHLSLNVTATDPAGNTSPPATIPLKVDHSGPTAPSDFDARFDPDTSLVEISWAPSSDPNLADNTPGSGVAGYRYRTSVNGSAWSTWTDAAVPTALLAGVTEGASVQAEIAAVDVAGNQGPSLSATQTASQSTATYANPGTGSGTANPVYEEPGVLVDENGSTPADDSIDDVPPGWGGSGITALTVDPYHEYTCTGGTNPACGTYNRYAAESYALIWADGRNSNYAYYGGNGGDCTNFASQALRAGGLDFMRVEGGYNQPSSPNGATRYPFLRGEGSWWSRYWSNNPRLYEPTQSFVRSQDLYDHLVDYGLAIQVNDPLRARPGDLVFYSEDPNHPLGLHHTQVVTRVKAHDSQVWVSQHSPGVTKRLADSYQAMVDAHGVRGVGWNYWVLRPIYERANIPAGSMP